jgi:hypothetical protein
VRELNLDRSLCEAFPHWPGRADAAAALEAAPLLEAVLDGGDPFVLIDLGAGDGRRLVEAVRSARSAGRGSRVFGVEADAERFARLREGAAGLGLGADACRLLRAAAAGLAGDCWFLAQKPPAWRGRSLVPDTLVDWAGPRPVPPGAEAPFAGGRVARLRAVDLAEVLNGQPAVDYLRLALAGAELEFLAARPALLEKQVKAVHVATRWGATEEGLRELFGGLGWLRRLDVPRQTGVTVRLGGDRLGEAPPGDGAQVWLNPRFGHAAARRAA